MIKLSASNIAWEKEDDREVLTALHSLGYKGLEFAPTKICQDDPYSKYSTKTAKLYFMHVYEVYGLIPCSMQSIWFGINKNIFGGVDENSWLIEYSKRAIEYAAELNCTNIVFGCPRNRNITSGSDLKLAERFFEAIGIFSKSHNVNFAIEPNPKIYGTNFLNNTYDVVDAIESWQIPGLTLNYDIGAAIVNNEKSESLYRALPLVSHIHLSEPNLACIKRRKRHVGLVRKIYQTYSGFFSIEMRKVDMASFLRVAHYLRNVLDDATVL